jgi:excisionase family DNA binding protein
MAANEGGDVAGTEVVLTNPALWLLDTEALIEAVAEAATEQLDPEGTGTVAQGVDRAFELRPEPAPAEARRLTYTVEEVAELLGVSRALAYEAVRRGEVPSLRIGRRILVPRIAIERMVAGAGLEPAAPDPTGSG